VMTAWMKFQLNAGCIADIYSKLPTGLQMKEDASPCKGSVLRQGIV
jgi:hypothetical protein